MTVSGVFRLLIRVGLCTLIALWAVAPPPDVDTPLRVFMIALALYVLTTSEDAEKTILRGEDPRQTDRGRGR